MTKDWKRAQIIKHIFDSLESAGFNRSKGAFLYRDHGLPVEIEFVAEHDAAAHITYIDDIVTLEPEQSAKAEGDYGYWNFLRLSNIAGRRSRYEFPDGADWEQTTLAKDLGGPILDFFRSINSYEAACDLFLSEGKVLMGRHYIVVEQNGELDQRDAILAAWLLATIHSDTTRSNAALAALKKYASKNVQAHEDVEFFLSLSPHFPNVLAEI